MTTTSIILLSLSLGFLLSGCAVVLAFRSVVWAIGLNKAWAILIGLGVATDVCAILFTFAT